MQWFVPLGLRSFMESIVGDVKVTEMNWYFYILNLCLVTDPTLGEILKKSIFKAKLVPFYVFLLSIGVNEELWIDAKLYGVDGQF